MTLFSEFENLLALSLLSFLDKKQWNSRVPFNVFELLNLSLKIKDFVSISSDETKKDFTPGHFVWQKLKNSFGVNIWFSYGWLRLYFDFDFHTHSKTCWVILIAHCFIIHSLVCDTATTDWLTHYYYVTTAVNISTYEENLIESADLTKLGRKLARFVRAFHFFLLTKARLIIIHLFLRIFSKALQIYKQIMTTSSQNTFKFCCYSILCEFSTNNWGFQTEESILTHIINSI